MVFMKQLIRRLFKKWFFAKKIASLTEGGRSVFSIYCDFKSKHRNYGITRWQYQENRLFELSGDELSVKCDQLKKENDTINQWVKERFRTRRFLTKYMDHRFENSLRLIKKRQKAYTQFYGLGEKCSVQYGVSIISEHHHTGHFKVGDYCLFARNCDIDITGDLMVGNGVSFAEGCKVLTHSHDFFGAYDDCELIPYSNRARNTPLKIGDNVLIGAHSLIMSGVGEIGENSIISAGSVVTRPVPANCVVSGNPAQVVNKIPSGARIYYRQNKAD
jgi:acetyltransferase-like isoleucine patch superfamily enzyme